MTMVRKTLFVLTLYFIVGCQAESQLWKANTRQDWQAISDEESEGIKIQDGFIYAEKEEAIFSSTLKQFKQKRKLNAITFKQSPQWDNWQAVPKVTPEMAVNAPVFIPVSDGDYWLLGNHKEDFANGYHAWHSTDMKTWKHYGLVTEQENRWVTDAEYVDGKFYIYFDKPNDEDPHLVIDADLTDGKQGEVIGMVFRDPSHGSDMAIFRDEDNTFHLIYEDWSPVNARKRAWDSPLAGHADSPDGIHGFLPHEYPPPIDRRGIPTGEILPYEPDPNQLVHGPDSTPYTYEVHEGPQDAFGDYAMIKVAGQYYIFCDYHSHDKSKSMRIGRWRSDDIKKEFVWDGEIGEGFHPDPTIGFAEGKFYLLVQRNKSDFISDGPWVDGVEVRVGVDTNNNGSVDIWTEFTQVKETYLQKPGYVKVITSQPAILDLSALAAGYAFKIEIRFKSKNNLFPVLDAFEAEFL